MSVYERCAFGDLHLVHRVPADDEGRMVAIQQAGCGYVYNPATGLAQRGSPFRYWTAPENLVEIPDKETL